MSLEQAEILDEAVFAASRNELGSNFAKVLGYFEEDGVKSVAAIEDAVRAGQSVGVVEPAGILAEEAAEFGAVRLSDLASEIEDAARNLVEIRQTPEQLVPVVVKLRDTFDQTMQHLKEETNPLMKRNSIASSSGVFGSSFGSL